MLKEIVNDVVCFVTLALLGLACFVWLAIIA
jgi:hypothetical protein